MPNDDDKTIVEQDGDAKDSGKESKQPKSGGSKKLIIFGGIGVGAIVIGLALAIFVVKPMMSDNGGEDSQTEEINSDDGGQEVAKASSKSKPKKKKKKKKKSSNKNGVEENYVFSLSDIVVNPAGTGGSRWLSVSFGFELDSQEEMERFEARTPIIRDALITLLSAKTVTHLTDPKQKEIIRFQIKRKLSKIMQTDELAAVYYTDFVMQ